jgi:protein O-GlcNAc transferase
MPTKTPLRILLQRAKDLLAHGMAKQALTSVDEALSEHPDAYEALILRGRIRWQLGQRFPALIDWDHALAKQQQPLEAALLLADGLIETGSGDDAARIALAATRWSPKRADAWLTLARARRCRGDAAGALAAAEAAIGCAPDLVDAYWHACVICAELRLYDKAGRHATAILDRQPDHRGAAATLLDARARASAWSDLDTVTPQMCMPSDPSLPAPALMDLAFAHDDPEVLNQATHLIARTLISSIARPSRRPDTGVMTICYLSPDLHEHPVSRMLGPVMRQHDRTRCRIMTAGISPPATHGPGAVVMAAAERHLDLSRLSDSAAATALKTAGVDVLIDLAGATTRNRYGILAQRPCPAQILWLGCPTGTGANWYDAFLLDDLVAPTSGPQHFIERIWRLPTCYHPITIGTSEPPQFTRHEAGIPENAIVLACTHAPHKVRPPMVDRWLRIARRNRHVVLWFDARDLTARRNIMDYAAAHGVEHEQLRFWDFTPDHSQYLAKLRLADLFLDNYPYGAHSTAGEALCCGVPVITAGGRTVHARVAASMLQALDLSDLICDGLDAYEARISALCSDAQALSDLRFRVVKLPIQDQLTRLVGALEDAYTRILAEAAPP